MTMPSGITKEEVGAYRAACRAEQIECVRDEQLSGDPSWIASCRYSANIESLRIQECRRWLREHEGADA